MSKPDASEFLENIEEMFYRYFIHADIITLYCVIRSYTFNDDCSFLNKYIGQNLFTPNFVYIGSLNS